MSNILQFDATSGATVNGTSISSAPANTNYSGVYVTSGAGSVTNAAINAFPHSSTANTSPFTIAVAFRKSTAHNQIAIQNTSYGLSAVNYRLDSSKARLNAGTVWRGETSSAPDGSGSFTISEGSVDSFVIRGVWSSSTSYTIDIFYNGTKYARGTLNTDPAHTPDRIVWTEGVIRYQIEDVAHSDGDCMALAASIATGFGGAGTDATGTGALASITLTAPTGTATGTSSSTNATGTGTLQSIVLTAPAGTATGTSAGSGTITTPVLKNNTGTVLANETGVIVNVYHASTGALIVQKTAQTSSALGVVVITDALLTPATTYAYEVILTGSRRRLPVASAA